MKLNLAILSVIVLTITAASLPAAEKPTPVKVFILAGQSNMEGQAVVDLTGKDYNQGRGTLVELLKDPDKAIKMRHLRRADGAWAERDDVWCFYQRENRPLLAGNLGVGFSVYGDRHHFGPELQFGHVVGDHFSEQVLLIKTAWGGKSLFKDFRPPSSGGDVGPYYRKMVDEVRHALKNIKQHFPAYQDQGYDLAGFVWYHGWNDGVEPKTAVPEYEQNLVNLINDVRKEFAAPKLPVVIGEITGPWVDAPDSWNTLREAQQAAAARPELRGNVVFVKTRDFVRKSEDSPNPSHGHHEFGNAETYFLVGDALGKGMLSLMSKEPEQDESAEKNARGSQPTSRRPQNIEGWQILVDERLQHPDHQDLCQRSLTFLAAKLVEVKMVVPPPRLPQLQQVKIVLDLNCGDLRAMQYHPDAGWLKANGFAAELEKCVHLPRAADVVTRRNINEQPWVILHELAHAYHDQFLSFDEPRIIAAYEQYKKNGRGEKTLLYNGRRVKHYALTNHKEFFAEMTESYFGVNDFYPFNRAELQDSEPELCEIMSRLWNASDKE